MTLSDYRTQEIGYLSDAARSGGVRDPYKERDVVAATDANNKAVYAYDVVRQAVERAARRRGRDAVACAIPSVVPAGTRNKKNRADNWVDRWKHWGNRARARLRL